MTSELRIVATAANEFEAEMLCGVLSEAGIESTQELSNTGVAGRFGGGGARDIYVREQDLERAREVVGAQAPEASGE
jgi:hypothetical protein